MAYGLISVQGTSFVEDFAGKCIVTLGMCGIECHASNRGTRCMASSFDVLGEDWILYDSWKPTTSRLLMARRLASVCHMQGA